MFKYDEKTATMTTRQGDTFSFEVEGVDDTWTKGRKPALNWIVEPIRK